MPRIQLFTDGSDGGFYRNLRRSLDRVSAITENKLLRKSVENTKSARITFNELSGSLGDMGTYIPLLVGMATINGLNISSALIFSGLFNILTGISFGIPMAVQPMKAIAAVAITEGLTVNEILAAGIVTGSVIFLFGITRIIEYFDRIIPHSVVRGIQLGLGIQLVITGISITLSVEYLFGYDSISVALLAAAIILFFLFRKRNIGALVVFSLGLLIAGFESPDTFKLAGIGFYLPGFVHLNWGDFLDGTLKAAIPQIPLTTLNSVIAVCALSRDLFPEKPAGTKEVSISVGLMNIIGCWFGAMPMCHGAGGLAGQYMFGARTGGSVIFLGVVKVAIGIFLGATVIAVLTAYPIAILGVLLIFAGVELARAARDIKNLTGYIVMLVTAAAIIGFSSTAVGFLTGFVLYYSLFHKKKLFRETDR